MRNIYKLQRLFLLLIVLFLGLSLQAQSLRLKKADKYFHQFSYDKAIKNYEALEDKSAGVYRNLAKSYLMLGNTGKAEDHYANLMNTGKYKSEDVYDYASVLMMNKKYDEAANWMQKFYKLKPEDSRAQRFMSDPLYYRELLKADMKVALKNLDINTELADFSPVYYQKDKVVFASSRYKKFLFNRNWNGNRQPFLDLFVADLSSDNTLSNAVKFDKNVNKKYHDAPATFNKEGDYMIVTRNVYDKKLEDNKLMLYESELQYDQFWSEPRALHFNDESYSCGHASMTPDGKLMYFASDMPGGLGGSDIYKVERQSDGSWGQPVNLGSTINTEGDEMFPYIDDKGGYLFYSSDGLPGLGGLDIFVSKVRRDGSFTTPLNLGAPINSNRDDFSFIYKENGSGFISSNRLGGKGDDDIYSFTNIMNFKDKIEDCYISGTITDAKTQQPLDFARVILYDSNGKELDSFETGKDGKYLYPIDCGNAYKFTVVRNDYQIARGEVNTSEFDTPNVVKDFALTKVNEYVDKTTGKTKDMCDIRIRPLYYDLDKFYIRMEDKVKLDKIVALMNEYPEMILELTSHTDARASKAYNVRLSNNRTNSVVQYLVSKGISKDRLVAKWMGEIYPVNGCVDGVKCSEAEHQLNRRTEFKILNCVRYID
jgi:outer membrane protein OmpA-like peptidoglycan-associated protein/tetratricopeptide (TPR) repeat protein